MSGEEMKEEFDRCQNLDHVRKNIDRIDGEIIKLISERSSYVRQAARLKNTKDDVRAPKRVEEVIARVRTLAEKEGLDPDIVEEVYRTMISSFIKYEMKELGK